MQLWFEKYRPSKFSEYVFKNKEQKRQVETWIKNKELPHLLLSGSPGVGKTALIKMVLAELDVDKGDILFIDGSRDNGVDFIRNTVTNFASSMPYGDCKYVFIDEFDYLSPNSMAALRVAMEKYSAYCRFLLSCNYIDKVMPAIQSRCQGFHIVSLDVNDITVKMAEILINENVEFEIEVLDKFVSTTYPDMRKCINMIQQHSTSGVLTLPDADHVSSDDYRLAAISLFRSGKFTEARKLICSQMQPGEAEDIFKFMYRNLELWADTQDKQNEAIIIIRNGLAKNMLVGDPEINISATFCELEMLNK